MSSGSGSGSIYINHTQKEIRYSWVGNSVYKALASWPTWDTEDDVECHNLQFVDLLPVVRMYMFSFIMELVKEEGYDISGAACVNLTGEDDCLSCEFDEDDETLYAFDKETNTMMNLDTGLPVRPLDSSSSEGEEASSISTDLEDNDEEATDDDESEGSGDTSRRV